MVLTEVSTVPIPKLPILIATDFDGLFFGAAGVSALVASIAVDSADSAPVTSIIVDSEVSEWASADGNNGASCSFRMVFSRDGFYLPERYYKLK